MNLDDVRNTIIVGTAETVLPTFPERSIPLFVFSPPYNLKHRADGKSGGGIWQDKVRYDSTEDAMPHGAYCAWLADVLRGCWRACNGAIFFNHKPRVVDGTLIAPIDYVPPDLRPFVRQEIIWYRQGGINYSPVFFMPQHERIIVLSRPEWRLKSRGVSGLGDVWVFPPDTDGGWHPAPFPETLPARALEASAATLVCDPFMGSGTTGKAARRMGRDYIGIEKSEAYAERARREIAAVEGRDLGGELTPLELWAERDAA